MIVSKDDRRICRTKMDLKKALVYLMNEKPFSAITVTEIVSHANYNRATFYRHFQDKFELINEYMNEIQADLEIAIRAPYVHSNTMHIESLTPEKVSIFQHVYRYADFYQLYKDNKGISEFQDRFIDTCIKLQQKDFFWPNEDLSFHTYRAYGVWGLILRWIKSDFSDPVEEITAQLICIISYQPPKQYKLQWQRSAF